MMSIGQGQAFAPGLQGLAGERKAGFATVPFVAEVGTLQPGGGSLLAVDFTLDGQDLVFTFWCSHRQFRWILNFLRLPHAEINLAADELHQFFHAQVVQGLSTFQAPVNLFRGERFQ